jgi:YbbR domain-containing protein
MKEFIRHRVLHNFGLKLLALVMAIALWIAVSRDPVAEVAVEVPIEFHHVPDNLEISSENVPAAQIRVRGPERLIHRLQPSEVHAEIDVSFVRPGERTFQLTAQQIQKPHDVEVVQVVPSQFQLDFDTRMTRAVDIHPRVMGSFAQGYRMGKVSVTPSTITITGPKKRVEAVEFATTDPVDVSGTIGHASFPTHAYVPDPLVQVVHPGPVRVTIMMERGSADSGGQ